MKRLLSGLTFDIASCSKQGDGGFRMRFLPAGSFTPADGRKMSVSAWVLTPARGQQIAAALNAKSTPLVIDYEHQTLLAEQNGKEAPASGWCRVGSWSMEQDGLYCIVDWVAKAAQMIEAKEYRFFSPVFGFDKAGNVTGVYHGALTNNPALDGFTEVFNRAAANFQYDHGDDSMKYSALLIGMLGLPADASEDQIMVALTALRARLDADGAALAAASRTLGGVLDMHSTNVAALRAKADAPDASKFVALSVLTATQTELATARTEIASLRAAQGSNEVSALVAEGLADGRILTATKDYWTAVGNKDVAALKSFLATQPKLQALSGQQTAGKTPTPAAGTLSDEEVAACRRMGITQEAYLKSRDGGAK